MSRPPITLDFIDAALRAIAAQHGGRPHLRFSFSDTRVDWPSIGRCDNGGLPAVDCGQSDDCRFTRPDGSSLHAHWYAEQQFVRFHLDQLDPRTAPLGHLVVDTRGPLGFLLGGLVGLAVSRGSGWGALLGAAAGTTAGLASDRLATGGVWTIETLRADGTWFARRLGSDGEQFAKVG